MSQRGHGAAPPAGTTPTFQMRPCGFHVESVASEEGPCCGVGVPVLHMPGDEPLAVLF